MQAQFDHNRGFGVEIETARNRTSSTHSIALALTNAGIPAHADRGHHISQDWKVVPDASTGAEIVSPILYGEDGLDQIQQVCQVLRNLNLKVDYTTGLHVHHDARDLTRRQYASAMYLYAKAADFINALLPTRVGSHWCQPLGLEQLSRNYHRFVRTDNDKYRMSGCDCGSNRSHYCSHRYYATNPTNANVSGTLEFRQHTGSLNANKINAWVVFTQGFINVGIHHNIKAKAISSIDPIAESLIFAMGFDSQCAITKAARQNIIRRIYTNSPWIYLGTAARYLTRQQRRIYRAQWPLTREQYRQPGREARLVS
jgi:hypothetical protein